MALTKRSDNNIVYLEVKHYCLWRALKQPLTGCDEVDATNPTTGTIVKKYGYRFDTVSGHAIKLIKYDTERKYSKRYFGFKLHLIEGTETYVLDMPYDSQILRRFLRVAHNIDWSLPLSITIFKGKKKETGGFEETGIWFQQRGETVRPYYTREQPHDMPEANQDPDTHEWDFRSQHRWLVEHLKTETIPDIENASRHLAPPIESMPDDRQEDALGESEPPLSNVTLYTDDDVPF